MSSSSFSTEILWQNSTAAKEASFLYQFINIIAAKYKKEFEDYNDFYLWSIDNPEDFWGEFLICSKIILEKNYDCVLKKSNVFNLNRWFYNAKLNFAKNLLDSDFNKTRLKKEPNYPALIALNEQGECIKFSIFEVKQQVACLAAYFKAIGIKPGDRIVGLVPNISQTVIAMLATVAVGAVWSACSPDFGESGVLERFTQITPAVMFIVDGYYYKNKYFACANKNRSIIRELSGSLKAVVCINYIDREFSWMDCQNSKSSLTLDVNFINWHELQNKFHLIQPDTLNYTYVDFNDPLYIMFSSGTTGKPKCIVHGVGGVLIEHFKEHLLHHNINDKDKFFYFTTTSWMMWHWQISAIGLGATIVIYDGAPNYPNEHSLIDLINNYQLTIFGAGAKYYSELEKNNVKNTNNVFRLDSLRMLLSTGSPLLAGQYNYIYNYIKADVALCSISGGTDILGCFALGNPLLPIYIGQLQCCSLGLNIKFYNDNGVVVIAEKGELVCLQPFPSMPIYFYNDQDGTKYHQAYFSKFDNIWAHGDYGELTAQNGVVIYGRSDTVLNPSGVRIGTAEIYSEALKISNIIDVLAVGQMFDGDERIILFVVLRDNLKLNDSIKTAIIKQIKQGASPRHVPAVIIQVPELPRTTSGKLVELAVKDIISGREVKNKEALANPWTLDYFVNLKQLQH